MQLVCLTCAQSTLIFDQHGARVRHYGPPSRHVFVIHETLQQHDLAII